MSVCEVLSCRSRSTAGAERTTSVAGSHPTDVRMTTRFKEGDLTEGLTGAIHETGHALYEQGRNLAYDGLPVNQVRAHAGTCRHMFALCPSHDGCDARQMQSHEDAD